MLKTCNKSQITLKSYWLSQYACIVPQLSAHLPLSPPSQPGILELSVKVIKDTSELRGVNVSLHPQPLTLSTSPKASPSQRSAVSLLSQSPLSGLLFWLPCSRCVHLPSSLSLSFSYSLPPLICLYYNPTLNKNLCLSLYLLPDPQNLTDRSLTGNQTWVSVMGTES